MIQEVFTYIIVFIAFAYTLFSFVKTFTKKSTEGCGSECSCSAQKDIKNAIIKKYKLNKHLITHQIKP
jgi:hypothetical protein